MIGHGTVRREVEGAGGRARPGGHGFGSALLAAALLAVLVYYLRFVLIPFVLAGALAFVLSMAVDWLVRTTGLPRAAVATGAYVAFLTAVAAAALFAYPVIRAEALGFITDLKGTLDKAIGELSQGGKIHILGATYDAAGLAGQVEDAMRIWLSQPTNLAAVAGAGFSAVFGAFLCAVLLFYFLLGGRRLVRGIIGLAPPSRRPLLFEIVRELGPLLKRYFFGVAVIVVYAAAAAYVGLGLILGLKNALALAIATGLLEMIPVVGPLLAAVLAGLAALKGASSIWDVLKFVVYATALRLSIDQLFGPLVLGRAASLSPVTVIFCFLAGGVLYGLVGVIMAVPAALTVRVTLRAIYGEADAARVR